MSRSPLPTQTHRGRVTYVSRLSEVVMCHLCAYTVLHNPESVIGSCCSPLDCVHIRHLLQGGEPGFEVQWEHTVSMMVVHSLLSLSGEFDPFWVKMAHRCHHVEMDSDSPLFSIVLFWCCAYPFKLEFLHLVICFLLDVVLDTSTSQLQNCRTFTVLSEE